MNTTRIVATLLLGLAFGLPAGAQPFPSKPVRIIVGYSAGGAVDVLARSVGQQLAASLGQPVIVDNKPGAATNIAVRALIDSPADGHTLLMAANALAANVSLFQPPPFDLTRDIVPVAMVGRVPVVIAVPADSALNTLARLVAAARAQPNTVTFGTPGNGSTPHLAMALFERAAGVSMTHVPYKGGSQAITDVMGGHVSAVAVNALEVLPHVKSGKLRVLAVMSAGRSPALPEVPTVAESGFPRFEAAVWYGLVAPAGTPAAVVARLNAEVQKAVTSTAVRQQIAAAGGEVVSGPPEQFGAFLQAERQRYEVLIREAGIKPD
jgi:tripartite-type tricarboxylate transporter receptor subunit TctC